MTNHVKENVYPSRNQ